MSTRTVTVDGEENVAGLEFKWSAVVRIMYQPAKISGPPENCYPEESEADIESLVTTPPGCECLVTEGIVTDAAWEKFDELERER